MRRIPNIKLTPSQLNHYLTSKRFDYGSEASIYKTDNPHTLYKIFANLGTNPQTARNKETKIEQLYKMDLDHCVKPVSTISMNGILIGYEMTYDPDDKRFLPQLMPPEELIHYLEQTKEILEYFALYDIIYGDVASRNILINRRTGQAKFCDMDNIQLSSLPIDLQSMPLKKYSELRGIDAATDSYMHGLMTLDGFQLGLVQNNPLYADYFEEEANVILEGLYDPKEFNGEYLVQYVKKKR